MPTETDPGDRGLGIESLTFTIFTESSAEAETSYTAALAAADINTDYSGEVYDYTPVTVAIEGKLLRIQAATTELTGANHTAGRSQQMVVFSDGSTFGDPYAGLPIPPTMANGAVTMPVSTPVTAP